LEIRSELISDGKISYKINFQNLKTGFYFDQCDNREFIERFVEGKMIDAFTIRVWTSCHLCRANSVTFVDSSEAR
jgi:23S rRNA G2069 N7-methylase RlmK/C1962 C5-methylase RlmI